MAGLQRVMDADRIEVLADLLAKSEDRRKVFEAVYSGGKKPKTSAIIAEKTSLSRIRVAQITAFLSGRGFISSSSEGGRNFYSKLDDVNARKDEILRLSRNAARLSARKAAPNIHVTVKVANRQRAISVKSITVEDIQNFSRCTRVSINTVGDLEPKRLPESVFKYGMAKILGETGTFKDWGGERNDLYTTQLRMKGKRYRAAIALKGPATRPPLTVRKLGKNGDQIPRLFSSAAEVFLVQFEGQISEEVVEAMETSAIRKSKETGKSIYYGIIAVEDSARLRIAYARQFEQASAEHLTK